MGFFFSGPSDHFSKKEIATDLKHLKLSGQQQNEFMEKLEEVRKKHGSDGYRIDHINEAARDLSGRAGDSLQSTQIGRIKGHFTEKHEAMVNPPKEMKEAPKVVDMREYKNLKSESLEVPKTRESQEPKEGTEGRMDKAA
jgi:hypothetical protein